MKYIILCGSNHEYINGTPRQLVTIKGERVLDRTIRLLKESGASKICITATDPAFESCGVPVIHYDSSGPWINCFPPAITEPATYIFGDVYFSEEAIKTIVGYPTKDIDFFASCPPFSVEYFKPWAEPFAFKVVDTEAFAAAVGEVKRNLLAGAFRRDPIAWETWQVIKETPLNHIDYTNYVAINDYTCDIDTPQDVELFERM